MVDKLPELWVATDMGTERSFAYLSEPQFEEGEFIGKGNLGLVGRATVPPGHKVRYQAVDIIDCRPKPRTEIEPEQIGDTAWRIRFKMRDGRYVTFFIMVDCNGTITHAPHNVSVFHQGYDMIHDHFDNAQREILEIDPDAKFYNVTAKVEGA